MNMALLDDAAGLVRVAAEVYGDHPRSAALLEEWGKRLREPLRLGVAGMVKAGKSTLLNALLGERIAPTDAGECTRAITWYRYGDTPAVSALLSDGSAKRLAVRRTDGRLAFDLGGTGVDEVERIDVRWPSAGLRSTVLIDTPGIESVSERIAARTVSFLTPTEGASNADAIIYLMRHVHPSDLTFLESFRDTAAGSAHTVNAIAVLSRADEVGAGRIDALLSARKIADRYRADPRMRVLALTVLPVAGLLAETARTLREGEFAAVRSLAHLDRARRDSLLLSVDRFVGNDVIDGVDSAARRGLIDRFGVSGIRLAMSLVRGGARSAQELSEQLVLQSGLEELRGAIRQQFRARQAALKVRAVVAGLEALLAEEPRPGTAPIAEGIERIMAASHELRELELLARARTEGLALPVEVAGELERLLGADGTEAAERLGLRAGADREEVRARSEALLADWRARLESPSTTRAAARVCGEVVRTLEGLLSEVAGTDGLRAAADVDSAGRPPQRGGDEGDQQTERGETELGEQDEPQGLGRGLQRRELHGHHEQSAVQQHAAEQPPARTRSAVGE